MSWCLQALLGYGDGDVFGMSCLSVCGPSSDKKVMRQIVTLQRSGQPGGAKLLCYKRDGTPFWSAPVPAAFGDAVSVASAAVVAACYFDVPCMVVFEMCPVHCNGHCLCARV